MAERREIEDFPCLENDLDFDEVRVCVLRDGHDGEHEFVSADELMVKLDDEDVRFAVVEQTVN